MIPKARHLASLGSAGIAVQEYVARRYYRRTPGPTRFVHPDERTAWTALWHEMLAPVEWLRLRASVVHRGGGVPRGDGAPVVLVHGFLTRGAYLRPFRAWLERMGYRAQIADIGWNADCTDVLTDRLLAVVRRTVDTTGATVHLIGHSFGGVLSRAAAARARDRIASVTTLGSPFRGLALNPALRLGAAAVRASIHARRGDAVRARCLTLGCDCASVCALQAPLPSDLPQLAIATRHDGVADWRYGVDPATTGTVHVTASHVGLVLNPAAYRAVALHLAAASPATRHIAAHGA
jgi:pimeloyl-ACP methyl ester carboxylesterase